MSSLGERIKEVRRDHNLTQQQFAEKISVSRPFISRVESGKENPSDSLLKLISVTYHIEYLWLKLGLGNKSPRPLDPYVELQGKIWNKELESLIEKDGIQNYSFCLSVLIALIQNPNVKENSRSFYLEQIKMILVSIDSYIKLSLHDEYEAEYEFQKKLKQECLLNMGRYIDALAEALYEENLDELLE